MARQDSLITHVPLGVESSARDRGKGDDVVQRLAHVRLDFHESPGCFSIYPQLHSHLVCLVSPARDSLTKRVTGGYPLLQGGLRIAKLSYCGGRLVFPYSPTMPCKGKPS
jgi:hypothetical protein